MFGEDSGLAKDVRDTHLGRWYDHLFAVCLFYARTDHLLPITQEHVLFPEAPPTEFAAS